MGATPPAPCRGPALTRSVECLPSTHMAPGCPHLYQTPAVQWKEKGLPATAPKGPVFPRLPEQVRAQVGGPLFRKCISSH